MSQFKTFLPLNLNDVFDSLPKKGLHIHGVSWNEKESRLEIVWETPKFDTGRSVPIEYPIELLQRRKLPKVVRDTSKKEKEVPKPVVTDTKPVAPVSPQNLIRTLEDYDKSILEGIPLEYMGVESRWQPVTTEHKFTEGFFYRKIEPTPVVHSLTTPANESQPPAA